MTVKEIQEKLKLLGKQNYSVYVPEYTFNGLRIDAIIINTDKRWVRGFEIKVNRSDFLQDEKWMLYSKFCSSLSIVCPKGLILPGEIRNPFGLLWIDSSLHSNKIFHWIKRPKNFQKRDALAWNWRYLDIIEKEFIRLAYEY